MDEAKKADRFSLSRWSRRKLDASRAKDATAASIPATPANASADAPAAAGPAAVAPTATSGPPELPPIESLTPDSDFAAFLRPDVDEGLRRRALRKLFSDPQFNVMDGLDVYIDDYNKTVPIPDAVLRQLAHAKYLFDPPKTRVNAQGFVEDVPVEEAKRDAEEAAATPEPPAALDAPGAPPPMTSEAPAEMPTMRTSDDGKPGR